MTTSRYDRSLRDNNAALLLPELDAGATVLVAEDLSAISVVKLKTQVSLLLSNVGSVGKARVAVPEKVGQALPAELPLEASVAPSANLAVRRDPKGRSYATAKCEMGSPLLLPIFLLLLLLRIGSRGAAICPLKRKVPELVRLRRAGEASMVVVGAPHATPKSTRVVAVTVDSLLGAFAVRKSARSNSQ